MAGRGWAAVCPAALRPGEEERKAPAPRSSAAPPREDAKAEGTRAGLCADCRPGSREVGSIESAAKATSGGSQGRRGRFRLWNGNRFVEDGTRALLTARDQTRLCVAFTAPLR